MTCLRMRARDWWLVVWIAKVASKVDANTFNINDLPGMFGTAGFSSMTVSTSSQTEFDGVSSVGALNVGDAVSVRGPMFIASGVPTVIASKVQKP